MVNEKLDGVEEVTESYKNVVMTGDFNYGEVNWKESKAGEEMHGEGD